MDGIIKQHYVIARSVLCGEAISYFKQRVIIALPKEHTALAHGASVGTMWRTAQVISHRFISTRVYQFGGTNDY
jgi:hypothetical protein